LLRNRNHFGIGFAVSIEGTPEVDGDHDLDADSDQSGGAPPPGKRANLTRITGPPRNYPNRPVDVPAVLSILRQVCEAPGHHFWTDDLSIMQAIERLKSKAKDAAQGGEDDVQLVILTAMGHQNLNYAACPRLPCGPVHFDSSTTFLNKGLMLEGLT
jgi:hypothetical protein